MRKFVLAASAVAIATFTLPSAAWAVGVSPELDQTCDDFLRAQSASVNDPEDDAKDTPFTIESVFIDSSTSTVENGKQQRIPGSEVGVGPIRVLAGSAANITSPSQLYRNGSSPNLHGMGVSTSAQFDDSSYDFFPGYTRTDTTTFGCRVFKVNKKGKVIEPPGLQVPGPGRQEPFVDEDISEFFDLQDRRTSPTGGGILPVTTPVPTEMVVCISPNSTTKGKAGSWVVKNGALVSTTDCANRSNALGGVTSNNAPTTG
jgi:hypothetical protein